VKKVAKPVAKAVKKEVKSIKKVVNVVTKTKAKEVKKAVKPVAKKAAPAKKVETKKAVAPAKKATPVSKPVAAKKAAPSKKVEPKKAAAPVKKSAPISNPVVIKKPVRAPKPVAAKKAEPAQVEKAKPSKAEKKGKAAKAEKVVAEDGIEIPVVLAPEDEAILAEALTIAKPKREAKVRKEVIAEGPIDGKPRTFKIGVAPAQVEKRVANPIHVASEMDPKQAIFVPIAKPEKHEKNQTNDTETMISINQMNKSNSEDAKKGISVESKLRHLYALQLIDSRIDKIRATRGELPYEVEDLKDEVSGLEARLERLNGEFKGADENIVACKSAIKEAEALIVKYKDQLNKVKNNREFDSLNKEIEFQELEIELQSKHIRTAESLKMTKQAEIDNASTKLAERANDLNLKETELTELMSETQKEEDFLSKRSDEAKKHIDLHLLERYVRMRKSAQNGLAVVPIERDASAGSFIQIPAQVQMDVRLRKRIITDEHSGRILVDEEMAYEEELKFKEVLQKEMAK
jgi:predicted  nucleic acid-binding Zn-ribbon protein